MTAVATTGRLQVLTDARFGVGARLHLLAFDVGK